MKQPHQSGELLGSYEEQVLLAVVRAGKDAYGMSVRRTIEQITGRSVTIGSVYATLDRLEAKDLVTSSRAPGESGPSRRIFALTAEGTRALTYTRATRERLWTGVKLQPVRNT